MNDERFDDLKEAYVLGALSDSEKREVEEYLAANPERQAEVDELVETASLLALFPEEREPPPELRRNIMSVVEAEAESSVESVEESTPAFRLKEIFSFPRIATGATVLVVVAGMLLWNAALQNEIQQLREQAQQPQTLELQASGIAQGASAEMVNAGKGRMILVAEDLPSAPEGKAYQLWAIEDKKPRPGSVFDAEGETTAAPLGTDAEGADAVAVTVEPEGGSRKPTSEPVLLTKL